MIFNPGAFYLVPSPHVGLAPTLMRLLYATESKEAVFRLFTGGRWYTTEAIPFDEFAKNAVEVPDDTASNELLSHEKESVVGAFMAIIPELHKPEATAILSLLSQRLGDIQHARVKAFNQLVNETPLINSEESR